MAALSFGSVRYYLAAGRCECRIWLQVGTLDDGCGNRAINIYLKPCLLRGITALRGVGC